jgi:hypothetical protein
MIAERNGAAGWDESVFRYLLAVEMARSRRMARDFLVVVVDGRGRGGFRNDQGIDIRTDFAHILGTLAGCLRETDLVGWHRTGRRASAMLIGTPADEALAGLLASKLLRGLHGVLGSATARRLRLRVYRYGASGGSTGFRLACSVAATGEASRAARPATARRGQPAPSMARADAAPATGV